MAGAQVQVEADMSILTGIDNGTGSAWQAPGSVSYPGLSSSLLDKNSCVTGYRFYSTYSSDPIGIQNLTLDTHSETSLHISQSASGL